MEQRTVQFVYAELSTIKESLRKIEQEIERLTALVAPEERMLKPTDYMSIVGLGASGTRNVSVEHDRYVGEAIADEHLR
jgi:hypothetical protein